MIVVGPSGELFVSLGPDPHVCQGGERRGVERDDAASTAGLGIAPDRLSPVDVYQGSAY